jgi:hypothetical protein
MLLAKGALFRLFRANPSSRACLSASSSSSLPSLLLVCLPAGPPTQEKGEMKQRNYIVDRERKEKMLRRRRRQEMNPVQPLCLLFSCISKPFGHILCSLSAITQPQRQIISFFSQTYYRNDIKKSACMIRHVATFPYTCQCSKSRQHVCCLLLITSHEYSLASSTSLSVITYNLNFRY